MKKIVAITVLSIVALLLTACGSSAAVSQANQSSGSAGANSGASSSSNPVPINGSQATGLSALELAAGTLKLDGTSNAVTSQEAAQLLPLWQSLQQIESSAAPQSGSQSTPGVRPNTAMMQQISAQILKIQNAMAPAQIQAITAMNLSRQDMFSAFQQAGITMGGPGQSGSGFRSNGGTSTTPQGTPPAAGTLGAPQGNGSFGQGGSFNGGRQRFGSFIPQTVITGIIQFLQTKAGS